MPESVTLDLGGVSIQLIPDRKTGEFHFVKKTALFISQTEPDITLNIHCGSVPEINHQKVVFETNVGWKLGQMDGKLIIDVPTKESHQVGVFPIDFSTGDIYVGSKKENSECFVFPLAYPMGELFMMNILGSGLGVLMHAAGVIYEGQGYLFAGQGGAGKTTCARFWQKLPGAQVINDDKVILRWEDGVIQIYGTPWHGEGGMALPLCAPLKQLYILLQSEQNDITFIPPLQMVKEKLDFTLHFFEHLIQIIPCRELGFVPDFSVVDFVLNTP